MYVERKHEMLAQSEGKPTLTNADSQHVLFAFTHDGANTLIGLTRTEFGSMVREVLENDNRERRRKENEDLYAILCGECAGHGNELRAAGLDPKGLCVVSTKAQGYDWHDEYADGVPLTASDKGECIGCGHKQ